MLTLVYVTQQAPDEAGHHWKKRRRLDGEEGGLRSSRGQQPTHAPRDRAVPAQLVSPLPNDLHFEVVDFVRRMSGAFSCFGETGLSVLVPSLRRVVAPPHRLRLGHASAPVRRPKRASNSPAFARLQASNLPFAF